MRLHLLAVADQGVDPGRRPRVPSGTGLGALSRPARARSRWPRGLARGRERRRSLHLRLAVGGQEQPSGRPEQAVAIAAAAIAVETPVRCRFSQRLERAEKGSR